MTERVLKDKIKVHDVITYKPAGSSHTITHRVVQRTPKGLVTRGDVNGAADAVVVNQSMLVGRAVIVLPGIGWAVRAVPWAVIGVVSIWMLTTPLQAGEIRIALRAIGVCAVVASYVLIERPLAAWLALQQQPESGGMIVRVASTGLLPIEIHPDRGPSMSLTPGTVRNLILLADRSGRVHFTSSLGLEPWGWAVVVLVCLTPLLTILTFGLPPTQRVMRDT